MSPEELRDATTSRHVGKEGAIISETLNTRPLADLAAALEKCHHLCYIALADSATDRKANPISEDEELSSGQIHAKIAAAFAKQETK